MLKKVSAVALSASMLAVSNCAISTKATGEEKATVATATQTKEQNKIIKFLDEHKLGLGIGAGVVALLAIGTTATYLLVFRDYLQKELNSFEKLAKANKDENAKKAEKQVEKLKAEAETLKKDVIWSIVKTKENEDKEFGKKIEQAFKSVDPTTVTDADSAAKFVKALHGAVDTLKGEKTKEGKAVIYRARKARLKGYDKDATKSMEIVLKMLKDTANNIKAGTIN